MWVYSAVASLAFDLEVEPASYSYYAVAVVAPFAVALMDSSKGASLHLKEFDKKMQWKISNIPDTTDYHDQKDRLIDSEEEGKKIAKVKQE